MTIKDYCLQISRLLEGTNNISKRDKFIELANQYVSNKKEALSKIKSIYGGMGSFNDMVLYKDGKVDFEGNEKLNILRKELYDAVLSEIIEFKY